MTRPLKIAYVITRSDSIGGAHVHVRDLARHLQAQGHDPQVLVGGAGPYTEELTRVGVPWRALGHLRRELHPGRDLRALRELRAALRALRPDLVSTHSSKAGLLGRLAARSLGLPVLFTAHGWAFTEGVPGRERAVYRVAETLAAPLAARIITVSGHDRDLARRLGVAPERRLVAVHNGMPELGPEALARPGDTPPTLIMVARFEPQKDHDTLLRALAGLQQLPWRLELVGDGPRLAHVRALAAELGLAQRVDFLGARGDVAARLARAQLFVLCSFWEGFPRSILEAMRAGLPVVASGVGGVRESVRDGETGLVVPPGEVAPLRGALAALLTDPGARAALGARGQAAFQARFTFARMLADTLQVYAEVLGHPSGAPASVGVPPRPAGD